MNWSSLVCWNYRWWVCSAALVRMATEKWRCRFVRQRFGCRECRFRTSRRPNLPHIFVLLLFGTHRRSALRNVQCNVADSKRKRDLRGMDSEYSTEFGFHINRFIFRDKFVRFSPTRSTISGPTCMWLIGSRIWCSRAWQKYSKTLIK